MEYTGQAKRALKLAEQAAGICGQNYVGSEHLLLGLLKEETGMAAAILREHKVSTEKVTERI